MTSRVARGIVANCYGQGVTLAIQFASVPVLISAWGLARYGVWVTMSAVPAVLSFADCGLIVATASAMTVSVGRGDKGMAVALFRQTMRRVLTACILCAIGAATTALVLSDRALPDPAMITPGSARIAICILAGVVLLGLIANLLSAGFRANGDYAIGLILGDSVRLLEAGAVMAMSASGHGLVEAALAWLVVRALGLSCTAICLGRRVPWIFELKEARIAPSIRRPASAALAIPAAFMVSLQGMTLVIGAMLSPSAVALFSATRTLTRAMVQASGLVNHAIMPEVSLAHGRANVARVQALTRQNMIATATILTSTWILLTIAGPAIMSRWTGDRLAVDRFLLAQLATAALVHGLWLSSANLLLATNRQADYAYAFLATTACTCVGGAILAGPFGVHGVAAAALGGEVVMAAWILVLRRRPEAPQFTSRQAERAGA